MRERVDEGKAILETVGSAHADLLASSTFTQLGAHLGRVTGLTEGDVGLQVAIEALDVSASSLDRNRVLRLSEAAEEVLAARPDVLDDPHLRDDLVAAMLQVDARSAALVHATEANETDLTLASTALDLVTTVRERGLRTVVMPLIAAQGDASLEDLRSKRTGVMLKLGEELLPQLELSEMDRALRDGAAHEDFWIEGDDIVLERGTLRLTAEELVDRVLAVSEFFTGLLRGVLVTMARTGRALPEVAHLPPRLRLEVARYLLAVQGITDVRLKHTDDRAIIDASGEVVSWPSMVAALTPLLPAEISVLEGNFRTNAAAIIHGRAELGPYRTYANRNRDQGPECCSNLLALMPVFAATRFDGRNPFDDDQWLGAAIHLVSAHPEDLPLLERIRRGRRARDLAALAGASTEPIDALLARTRDPQGGYRPTTLDKLRLAPLPTSNSFPRRS